MSFPRRVASLCLALAVLGAIATPAAADSDTHKLKKAKAAAPSRDAQAKRQSAQITLARSRLAQLDARANAALDGLQRASHAAQVAAQAQVAGEQVPEGAAATTAGARAGRGHAGPGQDGAQHRPRQRISQPVHRRSDRGGAGAG